MHQCIAQRDAMAVHGFGMFEVARRHYVHQWGEIQEFIEKEMKRRETL